MTSRTGIPSRRASAGALLADEEAVQAACLDEDVDPELFFHPEQERGPDRRARAAKAKAICSRCPIMDRCLDVALANREAYGVFGGVDEDERARMIRRHKREAKAAVA